MNRNDWTDEDPAAKDDPESPVREEPDRPDRVEVGLRIVYSLLFGLALSMMNSLLAVLVAFQLIYSLITERLPADRVQRFAHDLTAYYGQILRYLTHNDSRMPFPFSDFPEPSEPSRPAYEPRARGHAHRPSRPEDEQDRAVDRTVL